MKNLFIFIFPLLLLFESCEKDIIGGPQNADTLFPKPYFPIYPGSWWKYKNVADTTTFTDYAGEYKLEYANYDNFYSQYYYVPTWRGNSYFGYAFTKKIDEGYGSINRMIPLLKENLGPKWIYGIDGGNGHDGDSYIYRQVDSVGLTKIIGLDTFYNVLKIKEYTLGSGYYSGFTHYYYYAKDIGLIEGTEFNWPSPDLHYQIENYFINH